jgi:hypothetical protein
LSFLNLKHFKTSAHEECLKVARFYCLFWVKRCGLFYKFKTTAHEEAYTVHRLIGKRMTEDGTEKTKTDQSMRFADGSVVVFDEIYLNSVKMLADIWRYMKKLYIQI